MEPLARIETELVALSRLAEATVQLAPQIQALAERYRAVLRRGGTLFFAGNGGSAADAQHVAAEYMVRFRARRKGLAALALTTDTSVLTAAGNDLGFEQVFARQVEALSRPGDLLVLHSTSGESENLILAAAAAKARGVEVVALLGKGGGRLAVAADHALVIASDDTARIQEMQLAVQHVIAALIDREEET